MPGFPDRLKSVEQQVEFLQTTVKELKTMFSHDGKGFIEMLAGMRDHFNSVKDKCSMYLQQMDEVSIRNGRQIKENVQKAVKTIASEKEDVRTTTEELKRSVQKDLSMSKACVDRALAEYKSLDSKIAKCFREELQKVDNMRSEFEDSILECFTCRRDVEALAARVASLEQSKMSPRMKSPCRAPVKNLPARAELARRVDEMQTQLGRVANAVVEKKYDGVEDYEEGLEVQPGLPAGYQKTVVNAQEASRILKGKKRAVSEPAHRSQWWTNAAEEGHRHLPVCVLPEYFCAGVWGFPSQNDA